MPCLRPSMVPITRKSVFPGRRIRYSQQVPCGKCDGCRAEQARQWAVRMMHESVMHASSWFLTLTYSDENIPDNGSLYPEHLSGFLKGLRRGRPPGSVSFYGCGEYGETTQRAHYHVVLYGVDFLDRVPDPHSDRIGVFRSERLERAWGLGLTEFGTVTMGSCSYVAGYVTKKVGLKNNADYVNPRTGEILVPPFARMSLRPAIGRRWIERYWRDVYPRDFVVVDGIEAKPPRYYDKFMDLPDEKGGSAERRAIMEAVRDRRYEEMVDLSKYTLSAKQKIFDSKRDLYGRRDAV